MSRLQDNPIIILLVALFEHFALLLPDHSQALSPLLFSSSQSASMTDVGSGAGLESLSESALLLYDRISAHPAPK